MSKNIRIPRTLQEFAELFEQLYPEHDFSWRPYSNRWMGLCPFHSEKNPSFNIFETPTGLCFKCFACGASGSVYSLLKEKELPTFSVEERERIEKEKESFELQHVAEEFIIEAKQELLEIFKEIEKRKFSKYLKEQEFYLLTFRDKVYPKHPFVLHEPIKMEEAINFFGIGFITERLLHSWKNREEEKYRKFYNLLEERLYISEKSGYFIFPYYSLTGHLVSFKIRDISSSSRTSRVFKIYNQKIPAYFGSLGFLRNWLKQRDGWIYPVIVVEGETDAISVFLSSKIPVLAVGSASNYDVLLESRLSEFNFIPTILPDFDQCTLTSMGAGLEAIVRLLEEKKRRKNKEKIYVLADKSVYAGGKDVNEALVEKGVKFSEILQKKKAFLPLKEAVSKFFEEWKNWKFKQYENVRDKLEETIPAFANVYVNFLGISEKYEEKEFSSDEIENFETDLSTLLGRFPEKRVSVVASFGGMGKTTYALMLSFEIACKEGKKVLFWTTEHSPASLKAKLLKLKLTPEVEKYYKLGKKNVFLKTDIPEPLLTKEKRTNKRALKKLKELFEKYDVLILDPLLSFVSGEENDNVVIRQVFNEITTILSEFEKPKYLIFLHHFGKLGLREALLKNEHIEELKENKIKVKRAYVEDLIRSVRGASAIVDTSRYVEAVVIHEEARERYILTIKTNEETRQEGHGERIPELVCKDKLFEQVKEAVEKGVLKEDDALFAELEKYGILSWKDFEEFYSQVPLVVLKQFVDRLPVNTEKETEEDTLLNF
jgi:hypothetical protein